MESAPSPTRSLCFVASLSYSLPFRWSLRSRVACGGEEEAMYIPNILLLTFWRQAAVYITSRGAGGVRRSTSEIKALERKISLYSAIHGSCKINNKSSLTFINFSYVGVTEMTPYVYFDPFIFLFCVNFL